MKRFAVVVVASVFALQGCSLLGGGGGGPMGAAGGPRPPMRQGAGPGPGPGGPAFAPGRQVAPQFTLAVTLQRFDANADKEIPLAEMNAVLKADFASIDTDGDGELNYNEREPLNAGLNSATTVSPVLDWNGDGFVDMREFGSQWRTLFTRGDLDGDGVLSVSELNRPPPSDMPGPPGGPGGPRGRPSGMPPAEPKGADQSGRGSGL